MPSTRRAFLGLLGAALAGCASESPGTATDSTTPPSPSPGSTGTDATATPARYDLPAVPDPADAALERWCAPATGVADHRLTVLGEALGADESAVNVGFTGDGELRSDAPEVVLAGVVDEAHVGEHAYLTGVEFGDGELTVRVDHGYPTETGTPTQVGMAMGVRYTARLSMDGGFPERVRVRHHGDEVATVDGPC